MAICDAETAERDHIQRALNQKAARPKEVFTFQKFVANKWWPTYPSSVNNRPSTVAEKEIHLRLHLVPRLGALRLDRIENEELSKLVASLAKAKMEPKTIRNVSARPSGRRWGRRQRGAIWRRFQPSPG